MWEKLFFLISIVIIFYISIRILQKFTFNDDTLNDFISQFKQNYISDIIILPSHKDNETLTVCPKGYEDLLQNYNYGGNFNGCGCKNNYESYDFYLNTCPEENCTNIEEIGTKNLSNFNKIHFCYKRGDKNYNDLINNIMPSDDYNKCQNSTHKVCGFFDSLNNIICLPNNEPCPMITTFLISDSKEYLENYKNKYDNDAEINIIDNVFLYILVSHSPLNIATVWNNNNNYNNKIFNNFRIDLSQPCLGGQINPKSELLFDLMKNKYTLTCDLYKNGTEIIDNLYIVLNEENYLDFLNDNNFNELNKKIFEPFNINLTDKKMKLYAKSYPGWSSKCLINSPDTFENFLQSSYVLNKISLMTIINSFLIILLLISIGIATFYFIKNFEKIFYLIVLGFLVLNLFYPLQLIANGNWIINNLSDEDGNFCGDESLNILLQEISDSCNSLVWSYTLILCITIFDIVVFIFIIHSIIKPTIKKIEERLIQLREFS